MVFFEEDKERMLFFIGTACLIAAMIDLTVFPLTLNLWFPAYFIPVMYHKKFIAVIFLIVFILYAFSRKYYRRQLAAIFLLFVYYCLFQLFASKIGQFF